MLDLLAPAPAGKSGSARVTGTLASWAGLVLVVF